MSVRYIFNRVEVDGEKVRALFYKKASHSAFSLLWDKVFSVEHQGVYYDEKGCKEFYDQVIESNARGHRLKHGALDSDQLSAGFEAIRRKKLQLGIPFDCA